MTKRDFLNNVANGIMSIEITEYARTALEKMDQASEKQKSRNAEKTAAKNDSLKSVILDVLDKADEALTATVIADQIDSSTQKIARLLKQLTEAGRITMTTEARGKGLYKVYTLAEV